MMYLVLLSGNHGKKKHSVCSNHSSRPKRRRLRKQVSLPHFSPFRTLALQESSVPAGSGALYHPAECRHGLVQRGAGSFPIAFADGIDDTVS